MKVNVFKVPSYSLRDVEYQISFELVSMLETKVYCNCLGFQNHDHCKHSDKIKYELDLYIDKLINAMDVVAIAEKFTNKDELIELLTQIYKVSKHQSLINKYRNYIIWTLKNNMSFRESCYKQA